MQGSCLTHEICHICHTDGHYCCYPGHWAYALSRHEVLIKNKVIVRICVTDGISGTKFSGESATSNLMVTFAFVAALG